MRAAFLVMGLAGLAQAGLELLPSGLVRTGSGRLWDFGPDLGPEVFLQPREVLGTQAALTVSLDRTLGMLTRDGGAWIQGENLWAAPPAGSAASRMGGSARVYGDDYERSTRWAERPTRLKGDRHWRSLAIGGDWTFAVDSQGVLWSDENSRFPKGRFSEPSFREGRWETELRPWDAGPWREVQCGLAHCAGLDGQGRLLGWGVPGRRRALGRAMTWARRPRLLSSGDWSTVRMGLSHGLALDRGGKLWAWGQGSGGALGLDRICQGKEDACLQETPASLPGTWTAIGAGEHLSAALDAKGTLWVWGFLGDRRDEIRAVPQAVPGGPWTALAVRGRRVLVTDREGALWTSRFRPGELVKVAPATKTWRSEVVWQGEERKGLAPACDANGRWGYLEGGQWKISPRYELADLWRNVGRVRKGGQVTWTGPTPDSDKGTVSDVSWLLEGEEEKKPGTQFAWREVADYREIVRVPKTRVLVGSRLGMQAAWMDRDLVVMQVAGRLGCMAWGDSTVWRLDDSLPREEFIRLCHEVKRDQAPWGLVVRSPEPIKLVALVEKLPTFGRPQDTLRLMRADPVWVAPDGRRSMLKPAGRAGGHLLWSLPDSVRIETDGLGRVLKPVIRPAVERKAVQAAPRLRLAALPWSASGLSKETEAALSDRATGALLATRRVDVLERSRLDAVLREQAFQASGACEEDCAARLGKLLGTDLVVVGNAAMVGQMGVLQARLVESSTGTVLGSATATTNDGEDALVPLVGSVLQELASSLPDEAGPTRKAVPGARVELPGGCFAMGAADLEDDAAPVHDVCVEPFRIDPTEVTNDAYERCVQAGRCKPAHYQDGTCFSLDLARSVWSQTVLGTDFRDPRMPVTCVDWHQADDYCRFSKGRLPTEAEWEYAARYQAKGNYPWGDDPEDACRYGNISDRGFTEIYSKISGARCSDGNVRIAPAASKAATPNGLHDMAGNAQEWTSDWYWESYYWNSPVRNPPGAENGTQKVVRGGGWRKSGVLLRPERRDVTEPKLTTDELGFRCVDRGAGRTGR